MRLIKKTKCQKAEKNKTKQKTTYNILGCAFREGSATTRQGKPLTKI